MSNDKKINIVAITLILIALLGSLFLPAYKFWFNILALAAFCTTIFYQCFVLYKAGKEWKKYVLIYLGLSIALAYILFI